MECLSENGPPKYIFTALKDPLAIFVAKLKASGEQNFVHINWGDTERIHFKGECDLVIELDGGLQDSEKRDARIIAVDEILHSVNEEHIKKCVPVINQALPDKIKNSDFITLLMGAPQKEGGKYTIQEQIEFGFAVTKNALEIAEKSNLKLVIITSPRTLGACLEGCRKALSSDLLNENVWLYEFEAKDTFNPYPGILGLPRNRLLIVTQDSASFISEAVASPIPVALDTTWPQKVDRYEKMITNFAKKNYLKRVKDFVDADISQWQQMTVSHNSMEVVADKLRARLLTLNLATAEDFYTYQKVRSQYGL